MINDTNFYFEDIHIEKFGKLENVSLKKAEKLNFIYSGLNYGKSTFLEAVKVMLCQMSECRIYNHFKQIYGENGYFKFKNFFSLSTKTELSWTAQSLKFYDRLIGNFGTNGKFTGYGYYQLVNENLKIKKFDGTALNFAKKQSAFPVIWNYTGNNYSFYDCLKWKNNAEFFDDENPYMKDYIIDFISLYNEDITDIFLKNEKIYVMSDERGEVPASLLGDFIYSAVVFYKFIAGCKSNVVLIDNFDCMLNGICTEAYAEMFLGLIDKLPNKDIQFFITVKDARTISAFFEILRRNKRQTQMAVLCLDKKSEKELYSLGISTEDFNNEKDFGDDLKYLEKKNEDIAD